MKILFIWRKYDQVIGGVERMSIMLMNEMVSRGHEVHLLSWDKVEATTYYPLDPRVSWFKLGMGNPDYKAGWLLRIKRALKIRGYIKNIKPDVALAFMDGIFLSAKISTLGLNVPMIEAERVAVSRFKYLKSGRYTPLIFQTLRLARFITVQVESYKQDYPAYLRQRIVAISNPVTQQTVFAKPAGASDDAKTLLSVGRLSYQKNYAVLIRAFAILTKDFPAWTLKIVGEGGDAPALQALVHKLDVEAQVQLVPATQDVQSHYLSSHLFCLPSLWEGFPNALAEALAYGLPAVGFADCKGVSDLIQDGMNGALAQGSDDPIALATALRGLMADDARRAQYGAAATQSMAAYKPAHIFDAWESLFLKAKN